MTEMTTLMEREHSGLSVELVYLGDNKVAILVKDGIQDIVLTEIPSDKAMDAFYHPFFYLKPSQEDIEE